MESLMPEDLISFLRTQEGFTKDDIDNICEMIAPDPDEKDPITIAINCNIGVPDQETAGRVPQWIEYDCGIAIAGLGVIVENKDCNTFYHDLVKEKSKDLIKILNRFVGKMESKDDADIITSQTRVIDAILTSHRYTQNDTLEYEYSMLSFTIRANIL